MTDPANACVVCGVEIIYGENYATCSEDCGHAFLVWSTAFKEWFDKAEDGGSKKYA
jgi:hypothetical protein